MTTKQELTFYRQQLADYIGANEALDTFKAKFAALYCETRDQLFGETDIDPETVDQVIGLMVRHIIETA